MPRALKAPVSEYVPVFASNGDGSTMSRQDQLAWETEWTNRNVVRFNTDIRFVSAPASLIRVIHMTDPIVPTLMFAADVENKGMPGLQQATFSTRNCDSERITVVLASRSNSARGRRV